MIEVIVFVLGVAVWEGFTHQAPGNVTDGAAYSQAD